MDIATVIAIASSITLTLAASIRYLFVAWKAANDAHVEALKNAHQRERDRADVAFAALTTGQERMREQSNEMVTKFVEVMTSNRQAFEEWRLTLDALTQQREPPT